MNFSVDWKFDTNDKRVTLSSSYSISSGAAAPSDGSGRAYGTCSNSYCHSNGTSVATGTIPTNTSPTWGSTAVPLACNSCHGAGTPDGRPVYFQNQPKSNSHDHMTYNAAFTCATCHYNTTHDGATIFDPSKHADGNYDVVPGVWKDGTPSPKFTYTFDPGGGICTNNCCHYSDCSAYSATWGNENIVSGMSFSVGTGCYEISFKGLASHGTPPYTYHWEFGDGQSGDGQTVSHVYPSKADYTPKLTVRDANQHRGDTMTWVTPQPVNLPPNAAKTVALSQCTATLTDLSTDPDYNSCGHSGPGSITVLWGGGQRTDAPLTLTDTPTNQTFTHTYIYRGTYYLSYFVLDNGSYKVQVLPNETITIAPPQLDITGRITDTSGAGISSVSVILKTPLGGTYKTTTTNAQGDYSFSYNSDYCSYTVEPQGGNDYYFDPAPRTVSAYGSGSNMNFTRYPKMAIMGRVTDGSGNGIQDIRINYAVQDAASCPYAHETGYVTTGADGSYSVKVPNCCYTVTPSDPYYWYLYDPTQQTACTSSGNVNFIGQWIGGG